MRLMVGAAAALCASVAACSHNSVLAAEQAVVPANARIPNDANILAAALDGDSAEVALAALVRRKATRGDVRQYAQTLIDDHGRGIQEGNQLAFRLGITPKRSPLDTIPQATSHLLARFLAMPNGPAFDTAFVNHEVRDHHVDLGETQQMAEWAKNTELAGWLKDDLPVLEKHLRMAEELGGKP